MKLKCNVSYNTRAHWTEALGWKSENKLENNWFSETELKQKSASTKMFQ